MTRLWRILLLIVAGFNTLSALAGGIGLMTPGAIGMADWWLEGTGFTYPMAGVILLIVVGGTQGLAFVLLLLRRPWGYLANAVAGFGMVLWIYVEVALLPVYSFLHTLYLTTGIAQLALTFACLGILSRTVGTSAAGEGR
ncbi:phosphoglycerol transferase MdoB-like AlkP superfamily enzyme [Leifsonia sp. AK011]|uniref:hypothetical protein n=1 Tax=Leifsonia sp. AK011 TaxID=2723075 RepID=UPI0015CC4C57|nr:hypothetical protein [Leifsonia sp. AK011]NYF11382.1 phosphoglycerol transferase MdoB-like AlkP superfamily enzyme [Leifsonia sp. AK011]